MRAFSFVLGRKVLDGFMALKCLHCVFSTTGAIPTANTHTHTLFWLINTNEMTFWSSQTTSLSTNGNNLTTCALRMLMRTDSDRKDGRKAAVLFYLPYHAEGQARQTLGWTGEHRTVTAALHRNKPLFLCLWRKWVAFMQKWKLLIFSAWIYCILELHWWVATVRRDRETRASIFAAFSKGRSCE